MFQFDGDLSIENVISVRLVAKRSKKWGFDEGEFSVGISKYADKFGGGVESGVHLPVEITVESGKLELDQLAGANRLD